MHEKIMNDFDEMLALETGATANKDENQVVGYYLLRNASISPTIEIKNQINEAYHEGKFKNALFIGIGGSSLGSQLLNDSIKFY